MNRWTIILAAAVACAGCFDNKGKPEDVPTVIGLQSLIETNRTGIVRVILRGDKGALSASCLTGLDSIKMIDLSERGTKDVPAAAFGLKGLKEFYFCRNGMVTIPDFSCWAGTLDYLNLDDNSIEEIPVSLASLTKLKWLRLNGNKIKSVPKELSALKDLRRIYLCRNSLVAVPEVIKEWQSLEDLSLDGNPITEVPDWLTSLPNLRGISMCGTRISKLPADLSAWKRLDFIALSSCPVSKEEMQRIRKALPDVSIVF